MLNKYAEYEVDKMTFIVKIQGERKLFGRREVHITPKEGKGQKWVELKSLKILTTPK